MNPNLFFLTMLVFAVSCTPSNNVRSLSTPTVIPTALPTIQFANPTMARDCGWGVDVLSWHDENGDGIWDSGEPPLENVVFFVDDTYNRFKNVSQYAVTNKEGKSNLFVWLPGCPTVAFEIFAEPPTNYIPTTPNRITPPTRGGSVLRFGFRYLGNSTATPRPKSALGCLRIVQSYGTLVDRSITKMTVASDGAIWVTYADGDILRIDATSERSTAYSTPIFSKYSKVNAIANAPDGTVWIGTNGYAARLEGTKWITYTTTARIGFGRNDVRDVAIAFDGTVWFAHLLDPVSRFNPKTNAWDMNAIPQNWLASDYGIESIQVSSNGSLWFFSFVSIYQYIFPTPQNLNPDWVVHKRDRSDAIGGLTTLNGQASIVVSDELIWLVGSSDAGPSIVRFNPVKREWVTLNQRTTKGAMPGGGISSLALAKDNSLWIGLSDRGVVHFVPGTRDLTNGTWFHYTADNGLVGVKILKTVVDQIGDIWFVDGDNHVMRCSEKKP
jgi:streptogramin lyase